MPEPDLPLLQLSHQMRSEIDSFSFLDPFTVAEHLKSQYQFSKEYINSLL